MLFHSYLRDGIVYVPTVAMREGSPVYTDIEPVAVVPATNTEALRRALLEAVGRKNIVVPVPKGKWPAPILLKYASVRKLVSIRSQCVTVEHRGRGRGLPDCGLSQASQRILGARSRPENPISDGDYSR